MKKRWQGWGSLGALLSRRWDDGSSVRRVVDVAACALEVFVVLANQLTA